MAYIEFLASTAPLPIRQKYYFVTAVLLQGLFELLWLYLCGRNRFLY